jgi:hypothetical protein
MMTGVVLAWARLELRRRRRALLVLALLVALSTGTVLAAVAGASRADTALDRLRVQTLPATLAVLPNQPGFDWDAVRALPGVAAVGRIVISSFRLDGIPDSAAVDNGPGDRALMSTVERPVVLAGRLTDPDRADEAVVSPRFVQSSGLGVGDVVDLRLYTPQQVDDHFTTGADPLTADGPVVPTTIVGVVRSPWFTDRPDGTGWFQPSAGLLGRYPANLLGDQGLASVNAVVRLDDESPAGIEAFRADLARVSGRSDIELFDRTATAAKTRETVRFESVALLLFGLAALAAALVLVGQAVARYVAAAVADLGPLRAVGMDRRTALGAALAPALAAGTTGVLAGIGLAVAASPLFPVGTAAGLEPAPGRAVDPLVLGLGGLVLLALLVAGAGRVGFGALRAAGQGSGRRSAVAGAAARLGLGVPVLVGLRFALEPGRGAGALPVRPALVGAVVGVLGVLAAGVFSTAVAEAAANPERFGQTQRVESLVGSAGEDFADVGSGVAVIARDPDVASVADAPSGVIDAGTGPVTVFGYGWRGREPFPTVLLDGRMPTRPDEIVLGPTVARALGVGLGERVPATGNRGRAELTVSGIGFVPVASHNNYDDGAWMTPEGFAALIDGFKFHAVYVALYPGADPEVVAGRLGDSVGSALGIGPVLFDVTAPTVESVQLRNVEALPLVLGAFLAVLAVGAVGHALATAVRRRRHDIAVLRALGMTRRQTRAVIITQATALAVIGLVFGAPLGLALGRVLWQVVADITPLQYAAPAALLAVLLTVPIAVVVANALAAWPGRRAARLRIATVLRAE